jgi:hypothetical protein
MQNEKKAAVEQSGFFSGFTTFAYRGPSSNFSQENLK